MIGLKRVGMDIHDDEHSPPPKTVIRPEGEGVHRRYMDTNDNSTRQRERQKEIGNGREVLDCD